MSELYPTFGSRRFMFLTAKAVLLSSVILLLHLRDAATSSSPSHRQLQDEVTVRGAPFSTSQDLTEAVRLYLEYHYGNYKPEDDYQKLIEHYGPITHWDVGRIDNFGNLFNAKRNPLAALAEPDLSQWNVGQHLDHLPLYLHDMFLGAAKVNFDVSQWNTSNGVHFNGMFENAISFEGYGLEKWNVLNGKFFMSMFSNCQALHRDLDLSSWQLPSAERMEFMFRNSSFGGGSGGDLCLWNDFLDSSVITTGMFLQSLCSDARDPNLLQRNDPAVELSLCSPCDKTSGKGTSGTKPNILLIIADQMRFDMIRHVQDDLSHYDNLYKIETPNLDRLLQSGAYFRNAYCQCAVCGPARTSLRTGCTIERTGIQHNDLTAEHWYNPFYNQRVHELTSLDHVLVEEMGYVSEYYGKWHMPQPLIESKDGSRRRVVKHNDFDYQNNEPFYKYDAESRKYKRYLVVNDAGPVEYNEGDQLDPFSEYPYTPIQLDARYDATTNTPLTTASGLPRNRVGEPNVLGMSALSENFTSSFFTGDLAKRAIQRLQQQGDPWFLTASFHSPHPPFVAAWKYLENYWTNQDKLFIPRNLDTDGHMKESAYVTTARDIPEIEDAEKLQEWTALYYALIEEIDAQVGILLEQLGDEKSNTLVIFTSDHGEMLGAHSKREKNNFYEESSRVPLLISYPGSIPENLVIEELASHLDIFATILDYAGGTEHDQSDGTSLRRFIEGREVNVDYEEDVVFAEWDFRKPTNNMPLANSLKLTMDRRIDDRPSFLVRHGPYKLMMHKLASTNRMDMMFDISKDPFEIDNLLRPDQAKNIDDALAAKAEHLRCMLLDWMERLDSSEQYFSDPTANHGDSQGDLVEILNRQWWKPIGFWMSHLQSMTFGRLSWNGNEFVRHEHLYMGTRLEDMVVEVIAMRVEGPDATYFRVDHDKNILKIEYQDCHHVRVSIVSAHPVWKDRSLDATLVVTVNSGGSISDMPLKLIVPTTHVVPSTELGPINYTD